MKDTLYLVLIILLIIFAAYQYATKEVITKEIYKSDTVLVRDTIRIVEKGRIMYKYKYVSDTVWVVDSTRFISCIDTTINRTTLSTCYEYPENIFTIDIRSVPDTITKYTIVEKPIFKYEEKKTQWWQDALKIGGGVLVGFLLGKVK